ncbi:14741_t:CDS:2, partial [Racocetra persica]
MTIPVNDAASETLYNSFNGSTVRPTNLRIDTTQSYVLDPGHKKQKSKSFEVDLNQQVNTQSSTMSSLLPVSSYTYHGFDSTIVPAVYRNDYYARMAFINEKRRLRREVHNAVERRRRDNINEKIQELCALIPDNFLYRSSTDKPNKGVILRKVVEYIKHLQQLIGEQQSHNIVLENTVMDMKPDMYNSNLNKLSQCNSLDESVTNGFNIQNNNTTQNKASQNNNIITS